MIKAVKQEAANNKHAIVEEMRALYPDIEISTLKKSIDVFFNEITTALICGDRVELRGFASWVVRKRKGKTVRNPKTNEKIAVGDKGSLYFRASKELNRALNNA
jgi:integration host factor subunit beta